MNKQLSIFEMREQYHADDEWQPSDDIKKPVTIEPHFEPEPEDKKRLTGQSAKILKRLRQGAVTNAELVMIALKYTSRISDVRAWLEVRGETVVCRKGTGGVNTYYIEIKSA